MAETVVLAYSGGLDTSIIVPWLREAHGVDVLCVAADVGQGEELDGLEAKALASGAVGCEVVDLREEFLTGFVWPTLRAGAVYGRKYLLGTSMARPIIARCQVEVARAVGAGAVAHGCTGKGNDQVRFELTYAALAPELRVIAPWREWSIRSREDALDYAAAHGVPVAATRAKLYSRDRNLWHISHEGGPLEDPSWAPTEDVFQLTRSPAEAPDQAETVAIGFEAGTPVAVDGEPLGAVALLERLNEVAGLHGVGRADIVEDRLVGMKSRGVYETPGGTLLYAAHAELEQLVLDRRTLALKDSIAPRYADLVYEGRWWTPEREAMDALVDVTQRRVTGEVRMKLYKGSHGVVGRSSPFSLYDERFVTFGEDDVYDQADAAGFIRLYGLPLRVAALRAREAAEATPRTPTPAAGVAVFPGREAGSDVVEGREPLVSVGGVR
ncbi:MAG TPA: argininosuccinate synthase [Longimicrobiales bacterium]|nr:argininosuccinate synthase [Longimicrobiales bacterium]